MKYNSENHACPTVANIILVAIGLGLAAFITYTGLTLAEVQLSHATGDCVRVIPTSAGTCETLPAKYAITWTK